MLGGYRAVFRAQSGRGGKLAIAIYHSLEDFVNIPKWLMGLGLDYNFFLGHYTIHSEETVLFAAPK